MLPAIPANVDVATQRSQKCQRGFKGGSRHALGGCLEVGTRLGFGVINAHPARASLAHPPGGITLGPEQGELGADFAALGTGINLARYSSTSPSKSFSSCAVCSLTRSKGEKQIKVTIRLRGTARVKRTLVTAQFSAFLATTPTKACIEESVKACRKKAPSQFTLPHRRIFHHTISTVPTMFFLRQLEREISIHPSFLNNQVSDRLKAQLYLDLEGSCNGEYYIVCIMDISSISPGRVRPGSGDALFTIQYRAILWKPFKGETVSWVI
jgi:hypothetical protein